MKHLIVAVLGVFMNVPDDALADHKDLALFVSPDLAGSGLTGFLLPRFSLKTGVSVHAVPLTPDIAMPPDVLSLQVGPGLQVFTGMGQAFAITQPNPDNRAAVRFVDWLLSDIGQRTVSQFAPDGTQVFTGAAATELVVETATLSGNAQQGEALSYQKCGRCHVIGPKNRMNGIGSTPSFALLRGFDDWQRRFQAFYSLNPHPSFTQIAGVTEAFDQTLPPPISPLFLTQSEIDDITAFVDSVEPVDLGAPLVHQ